MPPLLKHLAFKAKADKIELLRTGIPHRAIVADISTDPDVVDEFYTLTYWYQDQYGQEIRGTTKIRREFIDIQKIASGNTFTLLISPTNPEIRMPYFMATQFDVISIHATSISQDVSAKISTQITNQRGTIEPELLGASPRCVRYSSKRLRYHIKVAACVSVFASCVGVIWSSIPISNPILATALLIEWVFLCIVFATWEHSQRMLALLRNGVATQGIITEMRISDASPDTLPVNQSVAFNYEFDGMDGRKRSRTFSTNLSHARQLGLKQGATFTVLTDPKKPVFATPYFQIIDAEIIGAMGAKITHP